MRSLFVTMCPNVTGVAAAAKAHLPSANPQLDALRLYRAWVNPTPSRNKTFPGRVNLTTTPVFRPKRVNEKAFCWNRMLRFDIRWLQGCGRDQICRAS
jgi:hypothetical protein